MTKISWTITYVKFHWNLPGANELITSLVHENFTTPVVNDDVIMASCVSPYILDSPAPTAISPHSPLIRSSAISLLLRSHNCSNYPPGKRTLTSCTKSNTREVLTHDFGHLTMMSSRTSNSRKSFWAIKQGKVWQNFLLNSIKSAVFKRKIFFSLFHCCPCFSGSSKYKLLMKYYIPMEYHVYISVLGVTAVWLRPHLTKMNAVCEIRSRPVAQGNL